MANYNFLKQAKVKLVTGLTPSAAVDYPVLGLKHSFSLSNLTDGVVDRIEGKVGIVTETTGSEATVAYSGSDSPTGLGALTFNGEDKTNGGRGITLLNLADANAWEDATGDWTAALWIRSEITGNASDTTISNQARILSRDLSDGFGIQINQYVASGLQDIAIFGEPGLFNITASNLNTNQWYHLCLVCEDDEGAAPSKNLTFFLDGVLQTGTTTYTRTATPSPLVLAAGAEPSLNDGFNARPQHNFTGSIADVRLFTRALDALEINALISGKAAAIHTLEVGPELTFNQTFTEDSFSTKTIHTDDYFESSTITKANQANFEFTVPALKETDFDIIKDKLVDCSTFDLYVETELDVFKLETAVLTSGTFEIQKMRPLTLSVSGEASKLTLVGSATTYAVPGLPVAQSVRTHLLNRELTLTLNGANISSNIYSISAELQNDINWLGYETVNAGLSVTNASTAMYPTDFTIDKKTLSGSIGQYITDTTSSDLQNFTTGESLRIKAGETISSTFYGFDINMASCSFTNRANVAEVFTQNYDWRSTDNSTALSSIITI